MAPDIPRSILILGAIVTLLGGLAGLITFGLRFAPPDPPTLVISEPEADGLRVRGDALRVSGTVSPEGSTVRWRVEPESSWRNATVEGGRWAATVDTQGLADGRVTVTVQAVHAGRATTATRAFLYEANRPPALTVETPEPKARAVDALQAHGTAEDPDGDALAGEWWVTGGEKRPLEVREGRWRLTWDARGWQGDLTLFVKVWDPRGEAVTVRLPFVATGNLPPKVTIATPAPGESLSGVVGLGGTVEDPNEGGVARVEWRVGSGAWQLAYVGGSSWGASWDVRGLPRGAYVLAVRAVDPQGAEAAEGRQVVVRSNRAPAIRIDHPPEAGAVPTRVAATATFRGNVSDADGDALASAAWRIVSPSRPSAPWEDLLVGSDGRWEVPFDTRRLADGPHELQVRVTDSEDAQGTARRTFTVRNQAGTAPSNPAVTPTPTPTLGGSSPTRLTMPPVRIVPTTAAPAAAPPSGEGPAPTPAAEVPLHPLLVLVAALAAGLLLRGRGGGRGR